MKACPFRHGSGVFPTVALFDANGRVAARRAWSNHA